MSHRGSHRRPRRSAVRTAVVTAAVTAGVLAPAGAALASDTTPKPVASDAPAAEKADKASPVPATREDEVARKRAAAEEAEKADKTSPVPVKSGSDEARKRAAAAQAPRGAVAAGERPVTDDGTDVTALATSLSAAALLAGAGTVALRRRASRQR
ncbi:hypothetical protein [Streptomyces sp. NPDC046939]|uniref:hypothetical protein n=1 Tax=Streptomyces sp. NPDC046939 TaxID=3155376 RepID=UPI0034104EC9